MEEINLFYRFGVAVAIGLLVGLQREFAYGGEKEELFAGVRTFGLIGLTGCSAALAADRLGSAWAFASIMLALGALIVVAFFIGAWQQEERGMTTEVAALLTALAGALCYWEYVGLAAALAVATTALLSLKREMHTLAERMSREDLFATLKFAAITAIVLPVLPNRTYGPPPLDALNPYQIWLMVVFISGISFVGYLLIKVLGPRQGIGLTGVLGGLIASTPLTLSFSQRSREEDRSLAHPFALAILISWTIMLPRVAVEVAVVNAPLLRELWIPLAGIAVVGLGYCAYLYFLHRPEESEDVSFSNPFRLGPAIQFGLLYAAVLLLSNAAHLYLGDRGLLISSAIAGTSGMDAITLSLAQLSRGPDAIASGTASRALILAALSNTAVKSGIVLLTGSRGLRRALLPGVGLMLAAGIAAVLLL